MTDETLQPWLSREQLQDKYPRLYRLLNTIGMDSDMELRDELYFGYLNEMELSAFEGDAHKLPEKDVETFAIGESSDIEALAVTYSLQDLHFFLGECFDGAYTRGVYDLP